MQGLPPTSVKILESSMSLIPLPSLAMMRALLLTLTTITAVTSDQEFDVAHFKYLNPGYSYDYLQTPPTQKFSTASSLLQCAFIALNSQSEFFTYNKVSHVCKNYSTKNIMTVISTDDYNETSFYRNVQWIKTYALSTGAGSKVYDSFTNKGSPSSWNVDECSGTFCPNFFRHPILDFWSHLDIDEVKLVIYEKETAVATMIFNGRNTTIESWFSHNNLKSSPWDDLASTNTDDFSLEGYGEKRRFYIAVHNSCSGDSGWLAINEGPLYCPFDTSDRYPAIRYADDNSKITWSEGYGKGDSMAIFIRLRA